MVAADFGGTPPSYFVTSNGGVAWSTFGGIQHGDTTEAWLQDGSRVLAATLEGGQDQANTINTYSATVASGNFGAPINTFTFPNANLDQPWIRIGLTRVYVAYNNLSAANGQTAAVNVSGDGGNTYPQVITLDRVTEHGGSFSSVEYSDCMLRETARQAIFLEQQR